MLKAASRTTSYLLCAFALAACGGGGGDDGGGFNTPPSFQVGGSVSGLTGTGLVLQNNGGNSLTITANGTFNFSQAVATGSAYNVSVSTQPSNPTQTCTVTNGSGTVSGAAITTVNVSCSGQVAKFIYVPNLGSDNVSAYSVNATTGALTAIAGSPFATEEGPFAMSADRQGARLFVANRGSFVNPPTVTVFSINATTGALTETVDSPSDLSTASPPPTNQIAVGKPNIHPSGTLGYLALGDRLYGATVNATTGELTEIAGFPLTLTLTIGFGAFNGAGSFFYVPHGSGGNPGTVTGYSVNTASGVLTSIGSFATGGGSPTFTMLNPAGNVLLTPNMLSGSVASFRVDQTSGTLTAAAGSPFSTGANTVPTAVTVHPTKNFVYVTNSNNGQPSTIAGYQLDTTTGVLTPIPGSPFGTGGNGAVIASIDPTGKFIYTAHFSANTIQGFAIDQTSGALTAVPGGPFITGMNPFAANIDPSGKYLYSASRGSNTVSSFAINQTSGALTLINSLPTGTMPGATELVGLQ